MQDNECMSEHQRSSSGHRLPRGRRLHRRGRSFPGVGSGGGASQPPGGSAVGIAFADELTPLRTIAAPPLA